tara:strand:- start:1209 stop:1484 length:276 start_codon:yes stop_codon:yes gene_type:complete
MTKLNELLIIAKNIKYIEPSDHNDLNWTQDEVIFKSIHIALQHEIQIRAGLYITDLFPPIKIIYKSILNKYINYFTLLNQKLLQSSENSIV